MRNRRLLSTAVDQECPETGNGFRERRRSGKSRSYKVTLIQSHVQPKEDNMAKEKFIIEPHFRLHEWVAEEKGYFKDEGLDYEFRELVQSSDGASQQLGDKVGAMLRAPQ